PGAYHVVSCYLKLEPRDKTRGKYLIKIKNRIREALAALQRQELERALRAQVAADLERVQAYFGEPTRLPPARGIALSACDATGEVPRRAAGQAGQHARGRLRRAQLPYAHPGGAAATLCAGGGPDLPDPHPAPPRRARGRRHRRGRRGPAAAPAHLPPRPCARRRTLEPQARHAGRGARGGALLARRARARLGACARRGRT